MKQALDNIRKSCGEKAIITIKYYTDDGYLSVSRVSILNYEGNASPGISLPEYHTVLSKLLKEKLERDVPCSGILVIDFPNRKIKIENTHQVTSYRTNHKEYEFPNGR